MEASPIEHSHPNAVRAGKPSNGDLAAIVIVVADPARN